MSDIATYITPLVLLGAIILVASTRRGLALAGYSVVLVIAALAIAAHPATVYEPVAWLTLIVAAFFGFAAGWIASWNSVWSVAAGVPLIGAGVAVQFFLSKLYGGDRDALLVIFLVGVLPGGWLFRLIRREAPGTAA